MPNGHSKYKKMINLEIGILIHFQHPTIINCIGYSYQDFFNQKNVTIIMEYAKNGSLADLLTKSRNSLADFDFDDTARQIILIGVARAMKHLRQNNIIHRDLKTGNILIDDNFRPKVADFGLSKHIDTIFSATQSINCGTYIYMAPEMINGKRYNGKVDVYSFGILMYEVITDLIQYPFNFKYLKHDR